MISKIYLSHLKSKKALTLSRRSFKIITKDRKKEGFYTKTRSISVIESFRKEAQAEQLEKNNNNPIPYNLS